MHKDYDSAERDSLAIKSDPNDTYAHYNYGCLLIDVRRGYGGGEREFKLAINAARTVLIGIATTTGCLKSCVGDYDAAERECKLAINADPSNSDAQNGYSRLLKKGVSGLMARIVKSSWR